mmetsp:Transcript_58203/g.104168  ORF Transcript_58203/g.104168 Transcript_58203/m.104168 type:complete len:200 (-) Transcript_58203:194-793(-)
MSPESPSSDSLTKKQYRREASCVDSCVWVNIHLVCTCTPVPLVVIAADAPKIWEVNSFVGPRSILHSCQTVDSSHCVPVDAAKHSIHYRFQLRVRQSCHRAETGVQLLVLTLVIFRLCTDYAFFNNAAKHHNLHIIKKIIDDNNCAWLKKQAIWTDGTLRWWSGPTTFSVRFTVRLPIDPIHFRFTRGEELGSKQRKAH